MVMAAVISLGLAGCGGSSSTASSESDAASGAESAAASENGEAAESTGNTAESSEAADSADETASAGTQNYTADLTVFAAKSLNGVMEEIISKYEEVQPGVKITGSYDSSGTLMTQIEQGAPCDVFFSAAQKQMNQLADEDMVDSDTRADVVNNQVCVVTYKESGTKVTGLSDIGNASTLALADGTVPVGKYTREAMVHAGMITKSESEADNSEITTQEISDQLGGVTINECANVGAVTAAVSTGANEVGTVYVSDTHGLEDKLDILEKVSYDLTGDVIYPAAVIKNPDASDDQKAAAADFVRFLKSDTAKALFDEYGFDTEV